MPHLRQPSAVDLPPSTHRGVGPSGPEAVDGHRAAPPPPSTPLLRSYFRSGWAFLIPYLLTYLLYAWRKWPANPVAGDSPPSTVLSPPSTVLSSPSTVHWSLVPCLLYVYWAFHAINLVLAAIALRSWWKDAQRAAISDQPSAISSDNPARSSQFSVLLPESSGLRSQTSALGSASADTPGPSRPGSRLSGFSFQLSAFGKAASPALPWLLLALLFAIPGVYLEWPSDPWEHLRRITEWATHPIVANHSAGYKSFYFFAYSWVGWLSPVHLLSWLNVYYVAVCLLLAWQYYLLAKAVGLDRRWAFLSVIVNVLTFGNVCFSFYRYYALASTIFAQLGAVALTRIALEYARGIGQSAEGQGQKVKGEEQSDSRPLPVGGSAEQPHPISENQESKAWPRRFWKTLTPSLSALRRRFAAVRLALCPLRARSAHYSLLRLGAASGALLLLIAYNHIQGIGIAGLGVGAVIVWRLIEWKRSMLFWLGAIAVMLSVATVLWWPRQPQIDAVFRPGGWLNAWYGFNLFAWPSPAADRMMQILGLFGLLNLVAGVTLIWKNHVVGWLTLTPVIALALPFVSIPFANSIATEILMYNRMYFAICPCLALAVLTATLSSSWRRITSPLHRTFRSDYGPTSLAPLVSIALMLLVPTGSPFSNRAWNVLERTPDDVSLKSSWVSLAASSQHLNYTSQTRTLAPAPLRFLIFIQMQQFITYYRLYSHVRPPTYDLNFIVDQIRTTPANQPLLLINPNHFTSPYSIAAQASQHWHTQECALAASGYTEIDTLALILRPKRSMLRLVPAISTEHN